MQVHDEGGARTRLELHLSLDLKFCKWSYPSEENAKKASKKKVKKKKGKKSKKEDPPALKDAPTKAPMPGPTLDEMVVQSKDVEEGPESIHIEIQEIASKRDMHGAWALSFIEDHFIELY